jgi:polysaccharide export outer membrane protein
MYRLLARLGAAGLMVGAMTAGAQSSSAIAASHQSAMVLRPGDVIRLRIWREPDLSGDFEINEAGVVVLPRIGPVSVLAIAPDSVRAQLFERYRAFLSHSSIEIALLRRVQILGAVRNPGLYPLDPTMTIGDAVAIAGGATPDGDQKKVQIVRNGDRLSQTLTYHTRVADSPIRSGDQLFVPERGWFVRHQTLIATGATTIVSLIIALTR